MKIVKKDIVALIEEQLAIALEEGLDDNPLGEKVPQKDLPGAIASNQQELVALRAQLPIAMQSAMTAGQIADGALEAVQAAASPEEASMIAVSSLAQIADASNPEELPRTLEKEAESEVKKQLSEVAYAIKPAEFQNEFTADAHGEGRMARAQLYRTGKYAERLHAFMKDDDELPAWVQAKITKAADYLSSVKDYVEYEKWRGY
tara:strand:- start:941 stop:1552 length:612 start_codon:yes stop_codon:yes gene_type:complete